MEINADFSRRASVRGAESPWRPSPMPGVERRMLDRIGDEVARATTIVRYAPDSAFSPHTHDGGEEFLVLEGVFSDEHGDFPVGSYVRNPPTSRHTPGSAPGCVIFVKLHQFDPADRRHVRVASDRMAPVRPEGRPGVALLPLYADADEEVRVEIWEPGAEIALTPEGGIEILAIEGSFSEGGERFAAQDWLRLPIGAPLSAVAGPEGARVWIKTGHLAHIGDSHVRA